MTRAENYRGANDSDAAVRVESSPRHGDQGDRGAAPIRPDGPTSLTIAVSREAGSRGNTIGGRVGLKLGWPVYNQELLQALAHDGPLRQSVIDNLDPAAARWAETVLHNLTASGRLHADGMMIALARTIVTLAYQGEVVLIGRGAGYLLPRQTTLNVRIVAPLADRVAYMAQWLRLTEPEAVEQVRLRDARRSAFFASHFNREPNDVYLFDMTLNSSLLGEDLCADMVIHAARARLGMPASSTRLRSPSVRETAR